VPAIEARLRAEAHIAKGGIDPEQAELRRGHQTYAAAGVHPDAARALREFAPRLSMFRPERHDRAGRQDVFQSVWQLWTFVLPSCVCSPLRLRLSIGARARAAAPVQA
jgi:hypothetical protein